jgi:hypothetical protein
MSEIRHETEIVKTILKCKIIGIVSLSLRFSSQCSLYYAFLAYNS